MKARSKVDSSKRRNKILSGLQNTTEPMSAASIAKEMGVSRQIIVGDIALLRAEGNEIIATSRGYVIASPIAGKFIRKIACRHNRDETEEELATIISLGGEIIDVTVTHPYYGDMTGQLNITTMEDVNSFVKEINDNKKLLSDLTDGTHLHTIACKDNATFDNIVAELTKLGLLL